MTRRFPALLACATLILAATTALVATPIVFAPPGEGEPLTPHQRGPVPQRNPSVASDGHGWFAVWEDSRYRNVDVFGSGIGVAGEVLHPDGIPLAPTYTSDRDPQIVWAGDRWLAAFVNDLGIFTVRLTVGGAHLGSGLSIPASGAQPYAPTFAAGTWLAWSGDRALVAWYQAGGPDELRVALIDRDGSMITGPIPVAAGPRDVSMSVVADGEGFLLAWESMDDHGTTTTLRTVAISANGTVGTVQTIATFPRRDFGYGFAPVIGSHDGSRILLWTDTAIRGVRIGAVGELLEPAFTVAGSAGLAWSPGDVVPVDGGWIAAIAGGPQSQDAYGYLRWNTDAFLLRLGDDGRPVGPPVRVAEDEGSRRDPSIAADDQGRLFVAWEEAGVVRGRVFGADLAPLVPSRILGLGLTSQTSPRLTPHGTGNLLTWSEGGGRATMVDSSGALAAPILSFDAQPVVASTGQIALLVWTESIIRDGKSVPRAVAARLGPDGNLIDAEPFLIADGFGASSVASDGVGFMVVLLEQGPPPVPINDRFWTVPVSMDAVVGERYPLPPVHDSWTYHQYSAIEWTGEHYLAAWNERRVCIAGHCPSDLYAVGVSSSGVPLASEGVVVTKTLSREDEVPRDLACGPADCALVLAQLDARVIRLSRDGERLDADVADPGIAISRFYDPYSGPPRIAWDGERFVVGLGALAPLPSGAILRIVERKLVPLPLAHDGSVTRLYVDRVVAGRHRPVAR